MYKKENSGLSRYLNLILMDELCLIVAFLLAYVIRHGFGRPFAPANYAHIVLIFSLINIALIAYGGMFDEVMTRGYYKELAQTVSHVVLVELIGAFYVFSIKTDFEYSRIVIYLFGFLYALLSYCARLLWKRIVRKSPGNPYAASLFVFTTLGQAEETVRSLTEGENRLRCNLLGLCITDSSCVGSQILGVPVKADLRTYAEYLCREWCDEAYLSLDKTQPMTQEIIDKLLEMGIVVHFQIENFSSEEYPHQIVEKFQDRDVITLSMNMATGQQLFIKRAFDIFAGIVGSLFTLVLTLILGPLIFIESPGPIFFTQTRMGKNGRKFKIYKFRSMYMDAEERKQELMKQNRMGSDMIFKMENDPRIIGCKMRPDGSFKKGIGNFIRDWSLDEFPQFFNVLMGSMSVCGTRPPTVDEWNKYELHHRARLAIKPGITGMWQTSGRSEITDFEEIVRLDKEYIKNWSLGLDCRLILKTFKVVLGKEGSM